MTNPDADTTELSRLTDQCVMCGLCLPYCPTYQISQNEAESPRGRISLIKAYTEGMLPASDALNEHMQSCTGCLACQQVCPAKVNYQAIIDSGRYLYRRDQGIFSRAKHSASIKLMTNSWGHRLIRSAHQLAKHAPFKNRYTQLIRQVTKPFPFQTGQSHNYSVNVFPGCTGSLFDQQTLNSLMKILKAMKVSACLPDKITCCGAIHQHSGLLNKTHYHQERVLQYSVSENTNILLSFASGCGQQLNQQLANTTIRHFDAMHWLCTQKAFTRLQFSPRPQRILVHIPCTADNALQKYIYQILQYLPEIRLLNFADNISCCGAGGSQLLSPKSSNLRLIKKKVQTIQSLKPDVIVSPNIGCALNFRMQLEHDNLDIDVVHPLTLLATNLKTT